MNANGSPDATNFYLDAIQIAVSIEYVIVDTNIHSMALLYIEIVFQTSTSFDASIDGWITFANSLGHTDISTRYLTTQAQRGIVGAITSTVIGNLVR